MPTPTKGKRLGGSPAHERLMLANLATSLFEHGQITTTETRARRLRPLAERLITKAKRGDLHARRQVMRTIRDKSVVHTLFTEIGPRFENRPGGYTRITKLGPRKGDNAPMAVIGLVEALVASGDGSGQRSAAPAPAPASAAAPAAAAAPAPEATPVPDVTPTPEATPVPEAEPSESEPSEAESAEADSSTESGDAEPDKT